MQELGTDHGLVSANFMVIDLCNTPKRQQQSRKRSRQCHRWTVRVDLPELEEQLSKFWSPEAVMNIHEQLFVLQRLANGACSHRKGLRFIDPPLVKDLCKQRREATDPAERAWLVRAVSLTRAAAKRQWWQSLEDMAG